ncbi:TlpA family protein disulfide reductase [Pedobacter sp. WC2423]|uniref:TlpA family protein disulfide reductase n=1 Tax=Pedobacter sp. WC2423 TaxID=3234142 RepID=UPI003466B99D
MKLKLKNLPFFGWVSMMIAVILSTHLVLNANPIHSDNLQVSTFTDTIKSLNVGDVVPDIIIKKIVNDKQRSTHLSDYKDVLLILDFWTTGCTACIAEFPKMDSLQKVFGDQIKILAVTYEAESHINSFFKNNKYAKTTMLPSVVEDNVLKKWFKHWAIPHEAWIYRGKVIALTGGEYVTAKNIQYVLDGNLPEWPVKDDFKQLDDSKPLISKGGFGQTVSYTVITPLREGVHDKKIISSLDSNTKTRRNYFLNLGILSAYKALWSYLVQIPLSSGSRNRLILNVKDKSKYIYDRALGTKEEWNRKNQFCYESITPDRVGDDKKQYELMIADLNRLFGLDARWEKRLMKCLVLTRTSSADKIKSKGGETILSFDKSVKEFKNTPFDNLVYKLNDYENNPPIINETGYEDPVDIELKIDSWTDIKTIKKVLRQYGLDFKEEERELDVFVLTEK